MELLKTHMFTIGGSVLGAGLGYAYYHFIGCASGSCPITSNPVISTLYGAMMGGLFLNMFKKNKINADEK